MNNLKIGDKVNFVLGTSLLTGTITKFYKNPYNRDECSVKTEVKTYSHILLHRVSKIEDNQILEEKDAQITDLQHKLEVAEIAFNNLYEKFEVVAFEYAKMDTIPSKLHFKEQAENKLKEEKNG